MKNSKAKGRRIVQNIDGDENIQVFADNSTIEITHATRTESVSLQFDFEPYLYGLIHSFESSPLSTAYVELSAEVLYTFVATDEKKLHTLWNEATPTLDSFAFAWLKNSDGRNLAIFGDFGSGKSTFCKKFSAELARRVLLDPINNPIPLLIPLNGLGEKTDFEEIVLDHFEKNWGYRLNPSLLRLFLGTGRLLIILDGYDEIDSKIDVERREKNFEFVVMLAKTKCRIILTSRPGFFLDLYELIRVFMGQDLQKFADMQIYDLVRFEATQEAAPKFEFLRILELSEEQTREIIRRQEKILARTGSSLQHIEGLINRIYNLRDLVTRPILVDLVLKTAPKIEQFMGEISSAKLYKLYTDFWCEVEWNKGEVRQLVSSGNRLTFMRELAWQLFESKSFGIHFLDLQKSVSHFFDLPTKHHLDWFEHDVRTCTFLSRSDQGVYSFVHNSFMEYFLATKVVEMLVSGTMGFKPNFYRDMPKPVNFLPLSSGADFFLRSVLTDMEGHNIYKQYVMFVDWGIGYLPTNRVVLMLR